MTETLTTLLSLGADIDYCSRRKAFRHWVLEGLVWPILRPNTWRSLAEAVAPQRGPADADRLCRDQDALGIELVQNHVEAVAFGADAVIFRHREAIEEQHVCGRPREYPFSR